MSKIPTAHIAAKSSDEIASTVLMPGDPLRAKFIAENYLNNVTCFNETRGMYGYTGYYNGKRVSIMGSGMGTPSAMIYYYELFKYYKVDNIIRIGTAGSLQEYIKMRDIVIATTAHSDSSIVKSRFGNYSFSPTPDFNLLRKAVQYAEENELPHHVGASLSSDEFYGEIDDKVKSNLINYGALVAEMETAGLYMTALRLEKNALALFTISDNDDGSVSSKERETSFTDMIKLALEIAPE